MEFNPNTTATSNSGIFALPQDANNSELFLLPVPWDVTTSFHRGTALGPQAILESSKQLDLCVPWLEDFYEKGIFFDEISPDIIKQNKLYGKFASRIQKRLESGLKLNEELFILQKEVNLACEKLMVTIQEKSEQWLKQDKKVGLVGGDHSCPLGLIRALAKKWDHLSILHIDAHMDLRLEYQGFQHSHASIMNNVISGDNNCQLVQIGIRDYCPAERQIAQISEKITTYYGANLSFDLQAGKSWQKICEEIIGSLGDNVYISFDIDGLDPSFCPNTGTPVPGGLSYHQMEGLFRKLFENKKNIVGFDLCEVAPKENQMMGLDGNIGARLLYLLCGLCLQS